MSNPTRLAICISGGGTTLREVLIAVKSGRLSKISPVLIISSKPDAGGIEKAKAEGFRAEDICTLERKQFVTPGAFGEAILGACRVRKVDLVMQCGFIPLMPANVITAYRGRIFNQHPGPLDPPHPDFGGKGMRGLAVHHAVCYFAHRAHRYFATEATVHRVGDELDSGAVVGRTLVEVFPGDDAHTLAARVLPREHELVIDLLHRFSVLGYVGEMPRFRALIQEEEMGLLLEAKAAAVEAFPHG